MALMNDLVCCPSLRRPRAFGAETYSTDESFCASLVKLTCKYVSRCAFNLRVYSNVFRLTYVTPYLSGLFEIGLAGSFVI